MLTPVSLARRKAAGFLEGVFANGMTLMIRFLAKLLNIDGITKKVKELIDKIRKPVSKAIEYQVFVRKT